MKESNKEISQTNNNVDTLLLIDETLSLYKAFISKPTSRSLNNFIDAANSYKESFIEDMGKYKSTNANDITYGPEFRLLIDAMDESWKKSLFGHSNYISKSGKKYESFVSSISREDARRSNKGLREISDIQILNRALLYFSEYVGKPFQNAKSIREEAELKINPSVVKRFQKEDQDGNTKGPLKLFTKKINTPEDLLMHFEIETNESLNFTEFSIHKYQHYIHETKETKIAHSRAYYKAMPRRVYFEADKGSSRRYCWFESRKEFQYLARHFIDNYSNEETLIDSRIGLDQEMYESKNMTNDQFEDHLKEFSLDEEEYNYFKDNDFNFLVFNARYSRSPRQMLHHVNRSGTADWTDVCFYNDTQVTIRSFTNDLDFIPRVSGYSPDDFTGDILVMSNELPKLSHQALNFFSSELDRDYRVIMQADVGIFSCLALDPKLSIEDISKMQDLEGNYVMSIIKDAFERDNYNFDWLESDKEIVIESAKKLIESENLKTIKRVK